jgi:microcystin-dependent protein
MALDPTQHINIPPFSELLADATVGAVDWNMRWNAIVQLANHAEDAIELLRTEVTAFQEKIAEYPSVLDFPEIGETGVLYIDSLNSQLYHWDEENYISLSVAGGNSDWEATSGVTMILNKPAVFPPEEHTHTAENVTFNNAGTDLTASQVQAALIALYNMVLPPVGDLLLSTSPTNPSTRFPGTTWVAWGTGRVPVGINTADANFDTVEKTGGAKTVTLTAAESGLPAHNHSQNSHNHSQNAHGHNINAKIGSSGTQYGLVDSSTSGSSGAVSCTSTTATNNATTATNNANAAANASSAHTNLQPYIVCYMWKRTT